MTSLSSRKTDAGKHQASAPEAGTASSARSDQTSADQTNIDGFLDLLAELVNDSSRSSDERTDAPATSAEPQASANGNGHAAPSPAPSSKTSDQTEPAPPSSLPHSPQPQIQSIPPDQLSPQQHQALRNLVLSPHCESAQQSPEMQPTVAALQGYAAQHPAPAAAQVCGPLIDFLNWQTTRQSPLPERPKKQWIWRFSLAALLGAGIVTAGIVQYRALTERRIEQAVQLALAASPTLSIYHFAPEAKGKTIHLGGRVPSDDLRRYAEAWAQQSFPDFRFDNDIIVVEALPDPGQVNADVAQLIDVVNQFDTVNISHRLQGTTVILEGTAAATVDPASIVNDIQQVPGVKDVVNRIHLQANPIATRIYFEPASADIKPSDTEGKIAPIADFMAANPTWDLNILGYAHPLEADNSELATRRAQTVQLMLENHGVDRRRLHAKGNPSRPPDSSDDQPLWRSRAVVFELMDPAQAQ